MTTTVLVDVRDPGGQGVPLARVIVELFDRSTGARVLGRHDDAFTADRYEARTAGDGTCSVELPSNSEVSPANTRYRFSIEQPSTTDDPMTVWAVVPVSGEPVRLADIEDDPAEDLTVFTRVLVDGIEDGETLIYDEDLGALVPGPTAAADVAAAAASAAAAGASASSAESAAAAAQGEASAAAIAAGNAATEAVAAQTAATGASVQAALAEDAATGAAGDAAAAAASAVAAEAAAAGEVNSLIAALPVADAPTIDDYMALEQDGVLKKTPVNEIISVAPAAYTSDTFNRANHATSLGSTDLGVPGAVGGSVLTWAQTGGSGANLGITSNRAKRQGGTGTRYATVNPGNATHGVKVVVENGAGQSGTVGADQMRLLVRWTSSTLHYTVYFVNGSGWRIARINSGTTNLGSFYTGAVANGDTLELRANGTTIEFLHNDTVVASADETVAIGSVPSLGTATSCGFALLVIAPELDSCVITNRDAITFPDVVEDVSTLQTDLTTLEDTVAGLAVTATRSDWVDPLTGLIYLGVIYADPTTGHGDAIQDAITEAAAVPGVDKDNRMMVLVPPGTYARTTGTDRISMVDGVDVRGATGDPADVTVTSSVNNDTFEAGGKHCLLGFMTITHTGAFTSYAVHVDTLAAIGFAPELVMISLVLSSASKQACGIGTRRDQHIYAFDCSFTMSNASFNQSALYLHNDSGGTGPAIATFVDCSATSSGNGSSSGGLAIEQFDSGQADEFHWLGGTIQRGNVAANDLAVYTNGGGTSSYIACRIDTSAYTSSNVSGAGDLADVAWPVPVPTRMPARRYS